RRSSAGALSAGRLPAWAYRSVPTQLAAPWWSARPYWPATVARSAGSLGSRTGAPCGQGGRPVADRELLDKLDELIAAVKSRRCEQTWFTDKEAAAHCGISVSTLRANARAWGVEAKNAMGR